MKTFHCMRCKRSVVESEIYRGPLGEQHAECCAFVEPESKLARLLADGELWSFLFDCGLIVAAALFFLIVCLVLSGCGGAPFTSEQATELEQGGSSSTGTAGEKPTAGAGGAAIAGAAGRQNVSGSGGAPAEIDPVDAGHVAGAGGGGAPACSVAGWRASACDVCSSSPLPSSGASCAELLDCFSKPGCTRSICTYCEFPDAGVSDEATALERQVYDCKCGAP